MCGFGWASGPRESEVFCGAPPPPRGHREVLRPPGLPLSSGTALPRYGTSRLFRLVRSEVTGRLADFALLDVAAEVLGDYRAFADVVAVTGRNGLDQCLARQVVELYP
jgi:hypothetical protein